MVSEPQFLEFFLSKSPGRIHVSCRCTVQITVRARVCLHTVLKTVCGRNKFVGSTSSTYYSGIYIIRASWERHRSKSCDFGSNPWVKNDLSLIVFNKWPIYDHHKVFKDHSSLGRLPLPVILEIFSTFFQDQR